MAEPEFTLTPQVSERDHTQGPTAAPVTLTVFGDYECSDTRDAMPVVGQLREKLGERLCFAYRNFPLTNSHPHAMHAAEAAEAANEQGSDKFWEMHSYLFAHQDALEDADLLGYAALLGLDTASFQRDLTQHTHLARIEEDVRSGIRSGVEGTPTFYINGTRYDGSWDTDTILPVLERAGAAASSQAEAHDHARDDRHQPLVDEIDSDRVGEPAIAEFDNMDEDRGA